MLLTKDTKGEAESAISNILQHPIESAELDEARTCLEALESESDATAGLREAAGRAEQKLKHLIDLQTDTVAKTAAARRDLVAAQAEASAARSELETMRTRVRELEAEHASSADLRDAVERAERQLASVTSVQVQTLANYDKLEKELAASKKRLAQHEKEARLKLASANEQQWEAVRLATRCAFPEPLEIAVDDGTGLLVDLSTDGCQILLPAAVKPRQALKLVLLSAGPSVTCAGKVAWTRPEPVDEGQPASYRAGVAFTRPDVPALEAFMAAHAAPTS